MTIRILALDPGVTTGTCTRSASGAREVGEWTHYQRTAIAEMRPVRDGDTPERLLMAGIAVSSTDMNNGSPKPGDMIARNPKDHSDQWLVAKAYFAENFKPMEDE